MPTIRLGDEDRERFGCEEWLTFDERVLTDEAEAFEDAGGELTYFTDSKRVAWWRAMVWLALNRAGFPMKYAEVHFDLNAVQLQDEPGKAKSGSGASPTRRTSASSTPRSRRTRSKS